MYLIVVDIQDKFDVSVSFSSSFDDNLVCLNFVSLCLGRHNWLEWQRMKIQVVPVGLLH